jgi:hypothetical protein
MAGKKESDEMETPKCTSLIERERESSGIRISSQELVVVVAAAAIWELVMAFSNAEDSGFVIY